MQTAKTTRIAVLVAAIALMATACGGSSGGVDVQDPWGRPSPAAADNAAFYMELIGGSETDTLTAASSGACTMTEIHETSMTDGQMSMALVPGGLEVPANSTVILEPGGYHVMCIGVTEPFEAGDTVEVELEFSSGEKVTVGAAIRDK